MNDRAERILSMLNAQNATQRIMAGLPYMLPKDAIHEDFATVWLNDLALTVKKAVDQGGMATAAELTGMLNLVKHIGMTLSIIGTNPQAREKLKQYQEALNALANHIKAFAQRLQQQMESAQPQEGEAGPDPKDAAKVQAMLIQAQTKAKIAENSAEARTRQKEVQFQLAERRKDQQTEADIARQGAVTRHELMANRLKALAPGTE